MGPAWAPPLLWNAPGLPEGCGYKSVFAKQNMCLEVSPWIESCALSWQKTEASIVL